MEKATKYCADCGAEIDINAETCPKCGMRLSPLPQHVAAGQLADAWYFVAILFAVIGGLVAYVALRNRDSRKARNVIIVGVLSTLMWYMVYYS